jgi:hypothetical protein
VEQFLHKFFNGQRHPKKSPGPFDNGFIGKYRLDGASPKFFLTDNATADAYQRATQEAISDEDRWDLALVQIEKGFRELEGRSNPYLVTKHAFLAHQTPVQEFTLETASLWDGQLAYALNNMALATYSKLGGTPWLLRCDRAIAHELVIGIGSAEVGKGRLGKRERVVGFTTVFSGDGDYRIASRSRAVPYQNYGEELLATLSDTVDSVSRDMNWQDGDHVRLVFHAFKPFRDVEAEAVKTLMNTPGAVRYRLRLPRDQPTPPISPLRRGAGRCVRLRDKDEERCLCTRARPDSEALEVGGSYCPHRPP